MNSIILKLWLQSKIATLERVIDYVETEKEAHQIEGKLSLMKELYDDFNMEDVDTKEIIFHTNV